MTKLKEYIIHKLGGFTADDPISPRSFESVNPLWYLKEVWPYCLETPFERCNTEDYGKLYPCKYTLQIGKIKVYLCQKHAEELRDNFIKHVIADEERKWERIMSGGRFDYKDTSLKDEIFGYSDEPRNVFEDLEISNLVWDVLDLIHTYDWYASGDTEKQTYLDEKTKFKKKWLSNRGLRVRNIVNTALEKTKQELYETFNLEE